jgi:hypothetical protein
MAPAYTFPPWQGQRQKKNNFLLTFPSWEGPTFAPRHPAVTKEQDDEHQRRHLPLRLQLSVHRLQVRRLPLLRLQVLRLLGKGELSTARKGVRTNYSLHPGPPTM